MGLGDMTQPPLNPKDISVVPLAELLSHTKEGGAAPTSMDEMSAFVNFLGHAWPRFVTNVPWC